jgi:hypothetical protein
MNFHTQLQTIKLAMSTDKLAGDTTMSPQQPVKPTPVQIPKDPPAGEIGAVKPTLPKPINVATEKASGELGDYLRNYRPGAEGYMPVDTLLGAGIGGLGGALLGGKGRRGRGGLFGALLGGATGAGFNAWNNLPYQEAEIQAGQEAANREAQQREGGRMADAEGSRRKGLQDADRFLAKTPDSLIERAKTQGAFSRGFMDPAKKELDELLALRNGKQRDPRYPLENLGSGRGLRDNLGMLNYQGTESIDDMDPNLFQNLQALLKENAPSRAMLADYPDYEPQVNTGGDMHSQQQAILQAMGNPVLKALLEQSNQRNPAFIDVDGARAGL